MNKKKILFIQKHPFPYFGVMSLSAVLKKQGFSVDVLIGALEKDILSAIKVVSPDLIGFSVMSSEYKWLTDLVAKVKGGFTVPIVVGGIHASACPETLIKDKNIDYVITGEGEEVFSQLAVNIFAGSNDKIVEGVISNNTKEASRNNSARLVNILDSLPFEDRDIYYGRYPSLRELSLKQFISGRGCPFECSFCFNSSYKNLFKGKGPYVRRKSPSYFIQEIKNVRGKYGIESLFFADDLFAMDVKWLSEFSELFSREIKLPYMCTAIASLMTEDIARLLQRSGCACVSFGIETGNEDKRKNILKKNVSDSDIENCAHILKKHGIKIQTSNIFAFPGETIDDAFSTINLNTRIGTDYMFSTLMMPLPKTRIEEIAREQDIMPADYSYDSFPTSFLSNSIFKFKDVEVLENIQKISYLAMKLPKMEKFFRRVVRIKCRQMFFVFFAVSFVYRYKSERQMSFWDTVKLVWDFRKSY